ncbi:MAG: glycosyltransferase [Clostridia bacterium]|nr:glycosyltransferase [Clostridia bacterium]
MRLPDYLRVNGLRWTLRRVGEKAADRVFRRWDREWRRTGADRIPDGPEPDAGLISLLIPVYNTDPAMLQALLGSLSAQRYPHWEACVCLAGDRPETADVLDRAAAADPRIRVRRARENAGIAGNTNACLSMAGGAWVVLCDHDDLLPPSALWEVAEAIAAGDADVIYTDEDKITADGRLHTDVHRKPDFCPDTLRSMNYVCHLLAARRGLMERIGGERPAFDGSQDHDLILRLSEETDRIRHIPSVCYHWRTVGSSMSHQRLDRCLDAAARAVTEHMTRIGWAGEALPENGVLRLRYDLRPLTAVALVIGRDPERTAHCADALRAVLPEGTPVRTEVTDSRFAAMNRMAAEADEDLLLFADEACEGFGPGFLGELAMYAQRPDVGTVTPMLTDRRGHIAHAGFTSSPALGLRCRDEGLPARAGGPQRLNHVSHNVGAVSPACFLVRRAAWVPLDEGYRTAFGLADACLRMSRSGLRHVFTPHARAVCADCPDALLPGRTRDAEDLRRFRLAWPDWRDPCLNPALTDT